LSEKAKILDQQQIKEFENAIEDSNKAAALKKEKAQAKLQKQAALEKEKKEAAVKKEKKRKARLAKQIKEENDAQAAQAALVAQAAQAAAQAAQAAAQAARNKIYEENAKIRNKKKKNFENLKKNYPYFGTIEEGKIICCNGYVEFRKQYKKNIKYYFSNENNATEFTTENTVKIFGIKDNCFENDIEVVTKNDIMELQIAIKAKEALDKKAKEALDIQANKEEEEINFKKNVQKYRLPTYIGYIEISVFQRIELSKNSENLKNFLKNKPQSSPIIMSNFDSLFDIEYKQAYEGIHSKKFKNTSDIDTLIDNLKQTGQNADEKIKNYVIENFLNFNAIPKALMPNAEIVRIE
jgi:hypothetical protein